MERRNSENFALFAMMMDAAWVSFSLAFITTIRPALSYFPFFAIIPPPYTLPWILMILFPLSWVGIFLFTSVYGPNHNRSPIQEIGYVTLGSLMSGILLAGFLYLTYRDISRFLYVLFWSLAYLGLLCWRLIFRFLLRNSIHKPRDRKILIIGDNDSSQELAHGIKQSDHNNAFIINFLPGKIDSSNAINIVIKKLVDDDINDVIISVTEVDRLVLSDLVGKLHRLPIKVWIIPDYFQLTLHKAAFSELATFPLLDLRAPALDDHQRLIKRAFDLVVSIVCFPFFLLVMLVVAVWIHADSVGPILLRQRRVGENGTIFLMYKFRTMVANAEELKSLIESYDEEGNLIHKKTDDPRVTKAGKFLRRWSLDEIPQIINVLKGEMSLVGPRPELPYLVDHYEPWQLLRFTIPQGITGWWQVNGRSNKPMHLNTADDIYYVQNYSMWLDMFILVKTIGVVIKGRGAF